MCIIILYYIYYIHIIYIVYSCSQDLGWLKIKVYSVFCIQVRDLGLVAVYEKSSGDGKLGQLRRLTAAVGTAKTAN